MTCLLRGTGPSRSPAEGSSAADGLLIANAEVGGIAGLDVRCRKGAIVEVGPGLPRSPGDRVLDADGGALLPGLHDHHIHLLALAAASRSIRCGPPEVATPAELRAALRNAPGTGWIRGVGYHESVAGLLNRKLLDGFESDRPVRIQHRSGKMWFLNSAAVHRLGIDCTDGQLFRADRLVRERLADDADVQATVEGTSIRLARYGVTGITDTTHTNDEDTPAFFQRLRLRQNVNLMGDESLASGSLKIMLDDADLPTFDDFQSRIENAHRQDRPIAIHCVTRTELVFALAALREVGTIRGDRIEHAAVVDDASLELLRETPAETGDLTVVTQPNFIAERGDQYRRDIDAAEQPHLYRCRSFINAGVPLAGGTDAPFGDANPWAAMRAAVHRRTRAGATIGAKETLAPEQALALFTTPLANPGGEPRRVEVGAAADLCLLDRPWRDARSSLKAEQVVATVSRGGLTHVRQAVSATGPGRHLS